MYLLTIELPMYMNAVIYSDENANTISNRGFTIENTIPSVINPIGTMLPKKTNLKMYNDDDIYMIFLKKKTHNKVDLARNLQVFLFAKMLNKEQIKSRI